MTDFIWGVLSNFAGEVIFAIVVAAMGLALLWWRNKYHRVSDVAKGQMTPSPDGSHAAFESGGDIWISGVKGLTNITDHPGEDVRPVWSNDNKFLAFTTDRDNDWEIYVVNIKTGKHVRLTTTPGPERVIGWNADGDLLISYGTGTAVVIKRGRIEKETK